MERKVITSIIVLTLLATAQITLQQAFDEALQAARDILDARWRAKALKGIVEAIVEAGVNKSGLYLVALQAAKEIKDDYWRAYALAWVTSSMVRAGVMPSG